MSHILRGDLQTTSDRINCYGHWEGPVSEWRAHLVTGHCQFDGCSHLAVGTVSFGFFTNPGRCQIGAPMGVCEFHSPLLEVHRISVQVGGDLVPLGSLMGQSDDPELRDDAS